MGNIGNKPISQIYKGLLQLSSSGEIADVTGSAVGLTAHPTSGIIYSVKSLNISGSPGTGYGISTDSNVRIAGQLTASNGLLLSNDISMSDGGILFDWGNGVHWSSGSVEIYGSQGPEDTNSGYDLNIKSNKNTIFYGGNSGETQEIARFSSSIEPISAIQTNYFGIGTRKPTKTLTVKGDISASNCIFTPAISASKIQNVCKML